MLRVGRPGALPGATAGLAVVVLALALRLALGVPLPIELVSDRFLPLLPVGSFLGLLRFTGGPFASKNLAFFGSFVLMVGAGTLAGVAYERLLRSRLAHRRLSVAAVSALLLAGAAVAVLEPTLDSNYRGRSGTPAEVENGLAMLLEAAVLAVLVVWLSADPRRPPAAAAEPTYARRTIVVRAAGGALALASGGLLGLLYSRSAFLYDGTANLGTDLPPITPNDRFYVVTKDFADPVLDAGAWRFRVGGEVDAPREYALAELAALGPVEREITLECISNPVGGGLISNAIWTGVPLRRLIAAARPAVDVRWVRFGAPDGYAHAVPLSIAAGDAALLAFRMNGAPLPRRHGFPVRVLLPGAYGEVNVKWVERMELTRERHEGYYERQGWRPDRVHTMSRIDAPVAGSRLAADRPVRVRGVAFAGDRGIDRVELSTDGGGTWAEARLDYRRAKTAWALWSRAWTPPPGRHELVVRATDGDGTPQVAAATGIDPDGATGLHRIEVVAA